MLRKSLFVLPRPYAGLGVLRTVFFSLVAAQVVYLAMGNALINSGVAESLANRRPEKFRMTWGAAYTLYPGHIHASAVRMAGHTRRTVWNVQADVVSGRVAFLPLLAKEVRVPLTRADGVSGGASRIDVERPPAPAKPGGWTLRFDRIEAIHLQQANYGPLVLRGDGLANFGFVKQVRGGPMQVLHSDARFAGATAWIDGQPLLEQATVAIDGSIDRHLRAEAPGIGKLLKTVATIEVDARTVGLQITAERENAARLQRLARSGRLHGKLSWNRGSFQSGSQLNLSVPVESAIIAEGRELDAIAKLAVGPNDIRGQLQIAPGAQSQLHADAEFTIAGREVPIANPRNLLPRTDGRFRASWQFDSLAWLAELTPGAGLISFDGAGRVEAYLTVVHGKLQPGSRLTVPEVDASAVALGNVFSGNARAELQVEAAGEHALHSRVDATMARFSVAPVDARDAFYVTGKDLRLELVSTGEIAEVKDRFHARMVFKDAFVPDLRVYNHYLPGGLVALQGGTGSLSGDLRFDGADDVATGTLAVTGYDAVVAVGNAKLEGNFILDTRLRRAELQQHRFVADGSTLKIDSLRITTPDRTGSEGWWGTVSLPSASLKWGRPMRVDGRVSVDVRDLEPLLVMFAQRKHMPAWIGKVVDEGEARIDGHVSWHDGTFLLDDVNARNDRFEVLAQLRSKDKIRAGDLYARWGKLDVGVALDGDKRDFHLANAREWYEARPALAAGLP